MAFCLLWIFRLPIPSLVAMAWWCLSIASLFTVKGPHSPNKASVLPGGRGGRKEEEEASRLPGGGRGRAEPAGEEVFKVRSSPESTIVTYLGF